MFRKLWCWYYAKIGRYEAIIECDSCGRNELMDQVLIIHAEDYDQVPGGGWVSRQPWYALCRRCS